ncbi:hypothetical protein L596_015556 [Steinernema carpocapsae]|uniref:FLYWCH-type domain-containing protein n=1 Tax=Steinernema carpocapsae TaxID=34508 RepID=A0A4U5NGK8_STECR|nr:hypothetical protein L596_015556 [Steinernema carpocapsae]
MAEKMRTSRGKPLVLEGFGYVQHKLSSEGKQLWRCVQQRKFKCGGRAISDLDLADFRAIQEHALQSVALLPRPSSPPWAPSAL